MPCTNSWYDQLSATPFAEFSGKPAYTSVQHVIRGTPCHDQAQRGMACHDVARRPHTENPFSL